MRNEQWKNVVGFSEATATQEVLIINYIWHKNTPITKKQTSFGSSKQKVFTIISNKTEMHNGGDEEM